MCVEERLVDWPGNPFTACTMQDSLLYKKLDTQCLKITEKVSFNIASEASYVYILSGQKFIKNGQFGEFLKT